jgi:hypothetical protein
MSSMNDGYVQADSNSAIVTAKDISNKFYSLDQETPMKYRLYMFRQQFKEFSSLKQDQCIRLINLYDHNLNQSHDLNSSQFAILGSLFLYVGWLMLNASSVFQLKYKQGLGNEYFSSAL